MPIKVVKRYKIKEMLEMTGHTQYWLLDKLNENGHKCQYQQVNMWVNNKRRPSLDVLLTIADVFGMTDVRKLWEVK